MKRYWLPPIIVLTCCVMESDGAEPAHGSFKAKQVKVGDLSREYRLVAPKSVDLDKPAPLVVAFHGMLIDSKDLMPVYTKLNETAAEHRFLLVYPNALNGAWGLVPEKIGQDLAFFDALLKEVRKTYKVDPNRIHLVGMSNGGYFAHLVGKERSETVASVASHSGPLGLQTLLGVKAKRKFPVLIIHGDQDRLLPVAWARRNRDKYEKEGHKVRYVELKGVGHAWGTKEKVNEMIWEHFESHPLKKK